MNSNCLFDATIEMHRKFRRNPLTCQDKLFQVCKSFGDCLDRQFLLFHEIQT